MALFFTFFQMECCMIRTERMPGIKLKSFLTPTKVMSQKLKFCVHLEQLPVTAPINQGIPEFIHFPSQTSTPLPPLCASPPSWLTKKRLLLGVLRGQQNI